MFALITFLQYKNLSTTHCLPGVKKTKPANKDLVFGRQFTDHMLEIDVCTSVVGLSAPALVG